MIAPHPAGRLGWRLRVYLVIVAARSLGMGITYWVSAPRIWRSPAFDVIEVLAPLRTFAIVWLVLGLVAVGGVLFPGERGIRGVLVTSFGLELLFGLGVLLGTASSPAVVTWFTFAAIDLLVVGTPWTRIGGLSDE